MTATGTGLRERKKQKTKDAIESAAMELFARKGYEATTVAEIADAADVAPRTFFAYFPSKEDVVFCRHDGDIADLREHLTARPDGTSAIDAMRAWISEQLSDEKHKTEREALRRRLFEENESLAAHNRLLMREFEEVLAEAVVTDFGGARDDVRTQFVAAATVAVMATLADHYEEHGEPNEPKNVKPVDDALIFLRAGVDALKESDSA